MSHRFQTEQRWISESEPELGLGSVQQFTERTVTLVFPASGETRQYALESAPLRRVRFHPGDTIQRRDGTSLPVEAVSERNGLIYYRSGGHELPESELSDRVIFSRPEQRLRNGQVDPSETFDLRWAALQHEHRRRKSEVRGFVGGRIDLIPHQLFIAQEVAGRLAPRVLLADEVGLGKTIEASLILHRLIQTGRVQRALILVPEPLIHQWFVELLRRFNLWFQILDEASCAATETAQPPVNPFLEDQFVLCGIGVLAGRGRLTQQALAAGWDMLVVDEAHHLGWAPDRVSSEYALVEKLGSKTHGLLLLTATPEQFGLVSHFARLRLLDPERYYDLNAFLTEAAQYAEVAAIAAKLLNLQKLTLADATALAKILGRDEAEVRAELEQIERGDAVARSDLINDLVDQHGTGRVMFRNTRAVIAGFPKRRAHLYPLDGGPASTELFTGWAAEFAADTDARAALQFQPRLASDPRLTWLAQFVRELKTEKVLLICRSQSKVNAIDEALRRKVQTKVALFHEGLSLVQRDRNAAWFAEEDGAQVLLASEIGSEGRNFQFAHHLVLFDLPLDPEVLEQRIGRLDRIGQSSEVHIHVPFVMGTPQEVLARWFEEGLNAFEKNLRGGHELLERFGRRLHDLAQDFHETKETTTADLERLISETSVAAQDLAARLEHGRDRLLELNSFRPQEAGRIIRAIQHQDRDPTLETFLLSVFDQVGIHFEELATHTYYLGSAGVFADTFPGLPAAGITVTMDRQRALAREEIQFLTWDHPLATGALDLILGSEKGNSSFAIWPDSPTAGLCLEALYLLECVAPAALHVDRFLPPTPLRVVVNHAGMDASAATTTEIWTRHLKTANPYPLLDMSEIREELLPTLLKKAETLAASQVAAILTQARAEMKTQLDREILRLRELQTVNRNVRPAEIELLAAQQRALDQHITNARIRLDAVRLIQREPG